MLRTLSLSSLALLVSVACAPVSREASKRASLVEPPKPPKATKGGVEFVLVDRFEGKFKITNHSKRTITLGSMFMADDKEEPFTPAYPEFQYWKGKKWESLGYGGDWFANPHKFKPGESVAFTHGLGPFEDLERGTRVRISVDGFVSEPWKEDRQSPSYLASKKRYRERVRDALAKAGFKPELIQGDDFCERILQSMMKATESGKEDSFVAFENKREVSPKIQHNGIIRIDFASDEIEDLARRGTREPHYWVWWAINPAKFTPTWFRTTARAHVRARQQGKGVTMEMDDGSSPWGADSHFYLCVAYVPPDEIWSMPTVEKSEAMLVRMLDNLEPWLKDR